MTGTSTLSKWVLENELSLRLSFCLLALAPRPVCSDCVLKYEAAVDMVDVEFICSQAINTTYLMCRAGLADPPWIFFFRIQCMSRKDEHGNCVCVKAPPVTLYPIS